MPPRRARLNDYAPRKIASRTNLNDVDMEFAVLETRENSYVPPTKRSKAGWPHKSPSVADLARAGFFYKPSAGKDNVECFMCARQLDGWEKDDDPLEEHLKHGSDCAWALLMSIEQEREYDPSSMEDPTAEPIASARRTTFESIGWPHEGKKGWLCKIEKMVEAGWHFAPTNECEDYTSCVYCKLSLDGWEPKDDPFEEHHRRSPDCPFFAFAGDTAPSRRPKQKKGRASKASRTSKASRLSTQSNRTLLSQSESMADLESSMDNTVDNSMVSVQSTTSTTTKAKRKAPIRTKGGKAKKTKTTRSKKADPTPEPETGAEAEGTQVSRIEAEGEETSDSHDSQEKTVQKEASQSEPSYPLLPPETQEEYFEDAEYDLAAEDRGASQPTYVETGPPEKERTPIPVKQISPIKEQSKPPRPTISPQQAHDARSERRLSRKSQSQIRESSSSEDSDVENVPPKSQTNSATLRYSSPGAPPPKWTPADVSKIFKSDEEIELFKGVTGGELSDAEKNMTVQEWIVYIAAQAQNGLHQEAERMVQIFEREGQRALAALESIQCV